MKFLELSKEVSYAIRHAPWEYELEIHEAGWVPIQQLITGKVGKCRDHKLKILKVYALEACDQGFNFTKEMIKFG